MSAWIIDLTPDERARQRLLTTEFHLSDAADEGTLEATGEYFFERQQERIRELSPRPLTQASDFDELPVGTTITFTNGDGVMAAVVEAGGRLYLTGSRDPVSVADVVAEQINAYGMTAVAWPISGAKPVASPGD